jgi:signal transduction histidine kinase/HD-like signal output (HDOD) protein
MSVTDPLHAKRVELILQQLEQLPMLPAIAVRVLEVTSDEEGSADEVISLIKGDPSLTSRILQLVHSAEAGVRSEVNSVDRAVVLLGFEAVRSAVLALSVFETFTSTPKDDAPTSGRFSREEFWRHCVAVACAAELLAEAVVETHGKSEDLIPQEAFVSGLLHDLGKAALDAVLPRSFAKAAEAAELLRGDIANLERTIIGLDHLVVGKRLAERWNLPVVLRETIWLHGQIPQALPQATHNPRMVNLITLADIVARQQHIGFSGNYAFNVDQEELFKAIGLTAQKVENKIPRLLARIEQRAGVLQLPVPEKQELFSESMKRANQELSRVSTQLAMKNRRLQTRAKFFDALNAFRGQLRPDSPPQAVLESIGHIAASVLEVQRLAIFSLTPGKAFAETVLMDASKQSSELLLVDCPRAMSPLQANDGPVVSAGNEFEWLITAVGPHLPGEQRYCIGLSADGCCIGGIFWSGPAGEPQRLSQQTEELTALSAAWALSLRMAQVREESQTLAEQLSEANRLLQSIQAEVMRGRMLLSLGEMAAGAGHEMNTPLAVISGRSQLLASELTEPRHQATAKLIHEQSHRLSEIITELMDYAKPTPPELQTCQIGDLVREGLRQAKERGNFADRSIEITTADAPPVQVDPRQVSAALVEVLDNAVMATDTKSGKLHVRATFDPSSGNVVVTIADNGSGMDSATLARAFDPFFSAQPAGRRRGLGLAKAQRWIQSSGGSIKLDSRANEGTRAIIVLPAAPAASQGTTTADRSIDPVSERKTAG